MSRDKVYNFSAGPSMLPESALLQAQKELLDYKGSGQSVMEMSHRSPAFQEIFDGAKEKFAMVPMNLLEGASADYAVTGNFSGKAAKEAKKYGSVRIAADTAATGHDRIPKQEELSLDPGAKYFYYCANNTIYGTEWSYRPETPSPLVCDMSSDILTRPVDVSRYGLIFAGAQKNMAPAGLTVVVIDRALAGKELPITPEIMSYQTMIEKDSMLNTPPCWCIYMLSLVLDWLEEHGGVAGMEQLKRERAKRLYDYLDSSSLFKAHAKPGSRSDMNVTFRTPSPETDAEFVAGAAARGLVNLKGHRIAGGMRASLYNAMPMEGVEALLSYMKEFEGSHV